MNISPIKYFQMSPAFTSNNRTVRDESGSIIHRNTTVMFRQDINWIDLANFLESYFRYSKKVDVYSFACSDGSEPYSLTASIKNECLNPNKFFPIMASDYDDEIIKEAKKARYTLTNTEFDSMRRATRNKWDKYFNMLTSDTIEPNNKTKNCVNFKTEDIIDGLDKVKKGPKVIMARNFWPYLKSEDKAKILEKLKSKMDDDSLLIIGAFDQDAIKFDRELSSLGFEEVEYTDYTRWIAFEPHLVWKAAS